MQHGDTQPPVIYGSYKNGHVQYEDKPEQIYCDPELVVSKNQNNDEKQAVRLIMEKYDSLRCLDGQMDNLNLKEEIADEEDNGELSEKDIAQIEVFFRSHKTYVCVCRCLAYLYFYTEKQGEWELARTGVPVLLLDKGEPRARNKRMLQIVLAERGSGFVLWKDVIDNLSNYRAQEEGSTFQTMYLSSDHRKMAGLSFTVPEAAEKFLREIEQLTSDPLNISLSVPKQKKKKLKSFKKEKVKLARKCDISTPCCFEHVTSVALNDKKKTILSDNSSVARRTSQFLKLHSRIYKEEMDNFPSAKNYFHLRERLLTTFVFSRLKSMRIKRFRRTSSLRQVPDFLTCVLFY